MSETTATNIEGAEADADLLPRDPPPRMASMLSWFLIAVFGGIVAFAAMVPLPDSVRCKFVLASEGGSAPVSSPEAGIVEHVFVGLGQQVEHGQELLRLSAYVEPGESASGLRARLDRFNEEIAGAARLDADLEERHATRMSELRSDASRAAAEAEAAGKRVATLRRLAAQLEAAVAQGVVSERELLEQRERLQEAEVGLAEASRAGSAARTAQVAQEASRRVEIAERELLARRLEGTIAETEAELALLGGSGEAASGADLLTILAPHDGVIIGMPVERAGIVVERGQALVQIARPGSRLRAEIQIPERGAARVAQGQTVRLLFDAYPYTRHGVLKGVLTWVSPAASAGTLPAFARLEDASMVVDDRRRPLMPGMSGEARIDIGERTLLEYVFEPLQQVRQALRPGS